VRLAARKFYFLSQRLCPQVGEVAIAASFPCSMNSRDQVASVEALLQNSKIRKLCLTTNEKSFRKRFWGKEYSQEKFFEVPISFDMVEYLTAEAIPLKIKTFAQEKALSSLGSCGEGHRHCKAHC
jgi:hypothetical protein